MRENKFGCKETVLIIQGRHNDDLNTVGSCGMEISEYIVYTAFT